MTIVLEALNDGDSKTLWMALAASNLLCMLVTAVILLVRYDRKLFPLLIPKDRDAHIHIYAFKLTSENIALMSETAGTQLRNEGFLRRIGNLAGICIEDMLNLVMERSSHTASLLADCTLIAEDSGARVVMRDNGSHFDVNEERSEGYSFTKYTVDRVLSVSEYHAYVTATGYNSNELLFADPPQTAPELGK